MIIGKTNITCFSTQNFFEIKIRDLPYDKHRGSGMDYLANGQTPDWVANTTRNIIYYALHNEKDGLLDIQMVTTAWAHLTMGPPASADQSIPANARALVTKATPALLLPARFHNITVADVFVPVSIAEQAWPHLLQ